MTSKRMAVRAFLSLLFLATLTLEGSQAAASFDDNLDNSFQDFETNFRDHQVGMLELARQLFYSRFEAQDRIRSEGNSGLVGVRHVKTGSMDYHTNTMRADEDFAGMHDHATKREIMGFGNVALVMNGVQFNTKHTDYKLVKASSTSTDFHATEPITPPEVPPSVLSQGTVQAQVDEMIEYFKAFKEQNPDHRDYRPYFKPALCYIEGKWLADTKDKLDIPDTVYFTMKGYEWQDIHAQNHLNSQTGLLYFYDEQTPTMPRTIVSLDESGMPVYAQWHYRVLCHPVQESIPTEYFRVVDDLSYTVPNDIDAESLRLARGARFTLDEHDAPGYYDNMTMLDVLTSQIPGLDNLPGVMNEADYLGRKTFLSEKKQNQVNLGYYNRRVFDEGRDPGKRHIKYRGFNDINMFVALNEQPKVAPMNVSFIINKGDDPINKILRFSWMIPLEVIYLTPLLSWNPYDIEYKEGDAAGTVRTNADGSQAKPYNGNNEHIFFRTPTEMYTDKYPVTAASSDDYYGFLYVQNTAGQACYVTASGVQLVTPPISNGVGSVRLRYPILPLHKSGDPIMKELSALKNYITKEFRKLATVFENINERD